MFVVFVVFVVFVPPGRRRRCCTSGWLWASGRPESNRVTLREFGGVCFIAGRSVRNKFRRLYQHGQPSHSASVLSELH